jgi:uncharacterized membrane protein YeaQ/YmgE (transglycosylase-associated protein family)
MGLLAWILVGLIAGWLVGIIGAVLGGFLASAVFNIPDPISGFDLTTLVIAFLGAVLVVALVRALPGRSPA